MGITSRYKLSREGKARTIRKSVSCEPVLDFSSSEDEDRAGGGARLTSGSLTPSPVSKKPYVKKSYSEAVRPRSASVDSFQVGANTDDDVFAEDEGSVASAPASSASTRDGSPVSRPGRSDDEGSPSPVDAQGIYPPTACIFVANLAQIYDDRTLENAVAEAFSHWGHVYVKIRRDHRGMPFAFCQFTTDEHARSAENLGKGITILGRPCRTEMARANTFFIVYRNDGQPITVGEAVDLLSTLGEVAKAERLDLDVQRSLRLPPSILASYKMYDPKRDVVTSLRGNRKFTVAPHDPKSANNLKPMLLYRSPRSPIKGELVEKFERDRRSIYMGNLPMDMAEETLTNLAAAIGRVLSVVLFKRAVVGNPGKMTCFAFVEFTSISSATDAIAALNNTEIKGFRVKVDKKQSRTVETPRRSVPTKSAHYSHSTFPRRRAAAAQQPVSPLTSLFTRPADQKKTLVDSTAEKMASMALDKTPKNVTTITKMASAQKKLFTPTPKKVNGGPSNAGRVNVDTPIPPTQPQQQAQAQHAPVPMWLQHYSNPYTYAPQPPVPAQFTPMAPHGNAGMVYSTYSTAPGYPGMYPEVYPMGASGHMMPPQHMGNQHMGNQHMGNQHMSNQHMGVQHMGVQQHMGNQHLTFQQQMTNHQLQHQSMQQNMQHVQNMQFQHMPHPQNIHGQVPYTQMQHPQLHAYQGHAQMPSEQPAPTEGKASPEAKKEQK